MSALLQNGTDPAIKPIQLSLPLPHAPGAKLHLHITVYDRALLVFVTIASDSNPTLASLGSFVYALPNLASSTTEMLSTPLYPQMSTLDFTTRLAKLLARRTVRPVYVGCSASFAAGGRGGDVAEEMEVLRGAAEVVVAVVEGRIQNVEEGDA